MDINFLFFFINIEFLCLKNDFVWLARHSFIETLVKIIYKYDDYMNILSIIKSIDYFLIVTPGERSLPGDLELN